MSAAVTAPTAVDGGEELVHPLADVMTDQRVTALVSSRGKAAGLHEAYYVHPGSGLGESLWFGTGADCTERRNEVVSYQLQDLQISSPLDHTILRTERSSILAAEPYSPESPSSCPPPAVYFSPLSNYKPLPTMPGDRELYYDELMVKFTTHAMKVFESAQYEGPNLEYQSIEFAERSLEHHNNDPNNEVEYELIKVMESNYMLESDSAYGHVNFIAKAKKDGFKEQLFFAELCLQGENNFLTCFCCLKDEEDQTGGCMEVDREGRGIDLEHCYGCGDELKHPKDGALYRAGHCVNLGCYECP